MGTQARGVLQFHHLYFLGVAVYLVAAMAFANPESAVLSGGLLVAREVER